MTVKPKTYSACYDSGKYLFQNKTLTEAFQLMPAGSRLVSGNTNKKDPTTGETVTIVKAVFKNRGDTIELKEDV